ncbi:MAG TPA: cereblon family protein [Thermodesulfovibrionia bacterium]|nr:cereblon family protein [Thermodesulfovibrionia bacterium]
MVLFVDTKLLNKIKTELTEKEESYQYICRICRTVISEERFLLEVSGSAFEHTFANPHGYRFNIYTFSECQSVIDASKHSFEHTWFPGYAWVIVCCAVCMEHLGWRFESANEKPSLFFGLIKEKLERQKV